MTDPSMMTEMVKGNMTSMVPMMVVGGWINWHFSGFVTTKVFFKISKKKPKIRGKCGARKYSPPEMKDGILGNKNQGIHCEDDNKEQ